MIAIHFEPSVAWQAKRAEYFAAGLKALGIDYSLTSSRERVADRAILFGTTFWRNIEQDGDWMLVDRASYGDPEYVQLVWNGHGRRGDHKVPEKRERRPAPEIQPWRAGERTVLCGQTETYSPHYASLDEWYSKVDATHFRGHPAGDNPTGLPRASNWDDVGLAVTLNSSIAVDAVINGVLTVTMDEGAMAWDVTAHNPNQPQYRDRRPWLEWLSWTQWSWDEIREGEPIKHLFEEI
jgi:hypothetical protein